MNYVDVLGNPQSLQEMLRHSGGNRRVPVIVDRGKVSTGFDGGS